MALENIGMGDQNHTNNMKNEATQPEIHTQEPWRIEETKEGFVISSDEGKHNFFQAYTRTRGAARHIVAAVNACAGIPTEVLEQMPRYQPKDMSSAELDIAFSKKMYAEMDRLIAQNAELAEALESSEEYWERGNPALINQCRAALAKHDPEIINLAGMDDQQARAALSAAVPDAIEQMRRFFDEHDQEIADASGM